MTAKSPGAIAAAKVTVTRQWIVDCAACGAGVETDDGPFTTAQDAADAKQRHLDEHERGDFL